MSLTTQIIRPPGQERPWPQPTKKSTIPFSYPPTGLKGYTSYWLWGDLSTSKQTPLICLHGGPGIPMRYLLPISLLHQDHNIPIIMYDQIGCGESTRFPEKKGDTDFWTPELFMAELDNLKEHLGIKEFDLLGQSWGGMLGGQYAITQPKGLRKLIICDSPTDMKIWVSAANKLRLQLPQDVQDDLTRNEENGTTDSEEYKAAVRVFSNFFLCRLEIWPKELDESFEYEEEDNTVYLTMNGPSEFYVVGSLREWSITDQLHKITEKTVPGGLLLINGYVRRSVFCFFCGVVVCLLWGECCGLDADYLCLRVGTTMKRRIPRQEGFSRNQSVKSSGSSSRSARICRSWRRQRDFSRPWGSS